MLMGLPHFCPAPVRFNVLQGAFGVVGAHPNTINIHTVEIKRGRHGLLDISKGVGCQIRGHHGQNPFQRPGVQHARAAVIRTGHSVEIEKPVDDGFQRSCEIRKQKLFRERVRPAAAGSPQP
jgi:hypothetical protein